MEKLTIEELQAENKRLRDLIVSLSATLLRNVVLEQGKDRRAADSADAERLVRDAEECFRCARVPGLRQEIAQGLEVAGREFMTTAVEIETEIQRAKWRKRS